MGVPWMAKRSVRGDESLDGVGGCPLLLGKSWGEATGAWREKTGDEREGKSWEGGDWEGKREVTRGKNLGKQGVKGTMANFLKLIGSNFCGSWNKRIHTETMQCIKFLWGPDATKYVMKSALNWVEIFLWSKLGTESSTSSWNYVDNHQVGIVYQDHLYHNCLHHFSK